MANIQSITVSSVARSAITAVTHCTDITIDEDPSVANWPTTDLLVSKTLAGSQRRVPAGQQYTFAKKHGIFAPGDTAGYVETVTGSTTIIQDEGGDT